ncbi:hypothetical protein E4H12_09540, partial [Candidatus Thorarchaeota archaeon]
MIGYDKLNTNIGLLLDINFMEGIRAKTHDLSKVHHQDIVLVNTPTWGNTAEGKEIITLDGATEYLELPNADCLDLDFTTEDYS